MASTPDSRILSLQAGRGCAAIFILAVHADQSVRTFVAEMPTAFVDCAQSLGYTALQYFFVLSGFIIYYANARRVGEPGWAGRYIRARAARIYLPYLPIGIAMAVAYVLLPDLSQRGPELTWSWFSTLTLLPSDARPALGVAWALQHELLFYVAALAFFLSGRFLACALGWAALILLWLGLYGFTENIIVRPLNLLFLVGAGAAWCVHRQRFRNHGLLCAAGAAMVAAYWLIGLDWAELPLAGLGIALLTIPLARLELERGLNIPPPLLLIGNASFAIFLIHWPVVALGARVLSVFDRSWPVAQALLMLAGIAAGIAYHLLIEAPLLRLLQLRRARLREPIPATAVAIH